LCRAVESEEYLTFEEEISVIGRFLCYIVNKVCTVCLSASLSSFRSVRHLCAILKKPTIRTK